MPTLKIYILGVSFKVKFKATHKKLYFPLEFMEENCKTEKFWAVFNSKKEEFWKPAFSVTEEIELSAMGMLSIKNWCSLVCLFSKFTWRRLGEFSLYWLAYTCVCLSICWIVRDLLTKRKTIDLKFGTKTHHEHI